MTTPCAVVDGRGREIDRRTVEHSAAGLRDLLALLGRPASARSRSSGRTGPVVETLLAAGLTVVVISPNQVKNLRGRYGSAGNKDDRFDAFVLADTLRTDRARLRPLIPDSRRDRRAAPDLPGPQGPGQPPGRRWPTSCAPTCATCSPARSACSPTSTPRSAWRFLARFDTQDRADWLTPKRLGDWLAGWLPRRGRPRRAARTGCSPPPAAPPATTAPPRPTSPARCSPS